MYQACVGALETLGIFTEVKICCCKLKVCMDVYHFKIQIGIKDKCMCIQIHNYLYRYHIISLDIICASKDAAMTY